MKNNRPHEKFLVLVFSNSTETSMKMLISFNLVGEFNDFSEDFMEQRNGIQNWHELFHSCDNTSVER